MSQLRTAGATRISPEETVSLLMVSTLLCLQRIFKHLLLSGNPVAFVFYKFLSSPATDMDNIDIRLWYKECMYALGKCQSDKPRKVSAQLAAAGFTFEDQERFEESIAENPEMAKALGSQEPSDEWQISEEESAKILVSVIDDLVVKNLILAKSAPTLACITRVASLRSLVIKHHGVQVLIDSAIAGNHDQEQTRVALATLCMSTDPHVWNYHQSISLAEACLWLIKESSYELFQFKGCIGLVNLLSYTDDVRDHIAKKPDMIQILLDTFSSTNNEMLQTGVIEVFCNLCVSEEMVEMIVDRRLMEPIRILGFIMSTMSTGGTTGDQASSQESTCSGGDGLVSAASGALALLTGYEQSYEIVESTLGCESFISLLDQYIGTNERHPAKHHNKDILLRVISILSNAVEFTKNGEFKSRITKSVHQRKEYLVALQDDRIRSLVETAF
jgi:hypothetical protein